MKRENFFAVAGLLISIFIGNASATEEIKIGFLVKQAEEPWYQDEWRFAEQAAKEKGFKLVKIAVPNGDKVLTAIDNLAAQHAQGFIVCSPDVKLGPAIEAKATQNHLKVMSVDDRLVDGAGKPITAIPHMGISAFKIGEQVGSAIAAEMKKRGWRMGEVGAIRLSYDQLPTAKERTAGAVAALKAAGVYDGNFIYAPQAKTDTENAFNAANIAITQNPKYKYWVAFGMNDEAVLGAVRASEGRGISFSNVIGVGIGGSQSAISEFAKKGKTGFFGTILISPKRHGYETSLNMYKWIKTGVPPEGLILTNGKLMTRDNFAEVRKEMGLQ